MFTGPPYGHTTHAVTVQRPPASWVITTLAMAALTTGAVFIAVILIPLPDPLGGGFLGLPGCVAITVIGSRSYACGPDWLRRGGQWVKLHHLTHIAAQKDRLSLMDYRQTGSLWNRWMRPGHVDIPLDTVRTNPDLHTTLQSGISTALQNDHPVRINHAAAEMFGVNATSTDLKGEHGKTPPGTPGSRTTR